MKVSVIIPTYNYGHFIIEAINSVLAQDYPKELIEVIVIDDGSTDNTGRLLQEIIKEKPAIQYHYQENAGKAAATQIGIALASGEIIFNLDADDWFLPGKISKTVQIFRHDPTLVHVGSPALIHWQEGNRNPEPEPIPFNVTGKNNGVDILKYFMSKKLLFGGGSTLTATIPRLEWNIRSCSTRGRVCRVSRMADWRSTSCTTCLPTRATTCSPYSSSAASACRSPPPAGSARSRRR